MYEVDGVNPPCTPEWNGVFALPKTASDSILNNGVDAIMLSERLLNFWELHTISPWADLAQAGGTEWRLYELGDGYLNWLREFNLRVSEITPDLHWTDGHNTVRLLRNAICCPSALITMAELG
jgi:hypothetical protein